jgi:hypothetical protein
MKKVTPGSATLSVVLVLALIWIAHWMGFNGDQIMTILGGAMMLAGMLTHLQSRSHKGGPSHRDSPPVQRKDEDQPAGKSEP